MMVRIPALRSEKAARAFAKINWTSLLPRLLGCARYNLRRLGWGETSRCCRAALEAPELVGMVIESCLSGEREWTLVPDATQDEVARFLFANMRAISTNCRTSAAVARRVYADADPIDERPPADEILAVWDRLREVERALEGDDEALALCRVLQDFPRGRREIAQALAWSVDHVSVVRRRLERSLAAKGLTYHDEGGPPSSSPHRRHHENPHAPGERRRAPRQPDGGPRLAGRRR